MSIITPQQWQEAKERVDLHLEEYKSMIGMPGVNTALAITFVFDPLLRRYNSGERSPELYDEMMAVE